MYKVNIKALSTNVCWKGQRYSTDKYNIYKNELKFLLPKEVRTYERMTLVVKVGFSSKLADLDNIFKPMIDILQKKYGFNDNQIYKIEAEKEIVKKGKEYIKFVLDNYDT